MCAPEKISRKTELKLSQPTKMEMTQNIPLVSVVIPSYNHAAYLSDAIESVRKQTYPNIEIIVVDDGSTDNTKSIMQKYPHVKYVFQQNQGLSAARNTGISNSKGEFLVFLDADDLLYDYAIAYNVEYLSYYTDAAFVSGAYEVVTHDKRNIDLDRNVILSDHYLHTLKGNYIGMHGTVMYRRFVFNEFLFDTSLQACEDYDIYLKVTRYYPVVHHTKRMAAYRMHSSNMSSNVPMMLAQALKVLKNHEPLLQSDEERKAHEVGVQAFIDYYCRHLFNVLRVGNIKPSKDMINTLRKYKPKYYYLYTAADLILRKMKLRKLAPDFVFQVLHKLGIYHNYTPKSTQVKFGDLGRNTPFSTMFGYDRGGPVDRYYIENFLQQEADNIYGHVLEIGDNDYTLRFGAEKVTQSDILHVDDSNPNATIVADLSHAPHIPDNSFDCIILTQTLHLIYDYKAVIETCFRVLKPGGKLLLTVPGITPIDCGEWEKSWLWSFTALSIEKILHEVFPIHQIEVNSFGNVLVATAFLYGMGLPEMKKEDMEYFDPSFPVIITATATKPENKNGSLSKNSEY